MATLEEVVRTGGAAEIRGGSLAWWWAVAGVTALFGNAVFRLGSRAFSTVAAGLSPVEWLALVALTVFFVYAEGVRALQRRWVPRMLGRAAELRRRRSAYRLLAPLYAMSLVGAPIATLLRAWGGVAAIVLAIILIRYVPEPWRGIVDFGVSAALAWGIVAIVVGAVTALRDPPTAPGSARP